jgi:hypothetical protein
MAIFLEVYQRCIGETPVIHRQFLAGEIPVFLRLFLSKISVSMGFSAQGVLKPWFFKTAAFSYTTFGLHCRVRGVDCAPRQAYNVFVIMAPLITGMGQNCPKIPPLSRYQGEMA